MPIKSHHAEILLVFTFSVSDQPGSMKVCRYFSCKATIIKTRQDHLHHTVTFFKSRIEELFTFIEIISLEEIPIIDSNFQKFLKTNYLDERD